MQAQHVAEQMAAAVRYDQSMTDIVDDDDACRLRLDNNCGRTLLRVLLQMTMSHDAQLTSISLRLLFRCFHQHQELIDDLAQVHIPFVRF
jgi:hypothetical protein